MEKELFSQGDKIFLFSVIVHLALFTLLFSSGALVYCTMGAISNEKPVIPQIYGNIMK